MIGITKSYVFLGLIPLALLTLVSCRYPSVERSDEAKTGIHAFIDTRYDDFIISFSGYSERPGAILFDLKADGRVLRGMGWHPASGKQEASASALAMDQIYRHWGRDAMGPVLSVIRDGDGMVLGYIYSPVTDPTVISSNKDLLVESIGESEIQKRANPGIRGAGG
jgi:hypothetical protein